MTKALIAPSILSADFARLGEEVTNVLQAGADVIHIDVMDNHYVPNLTFGPLVCKALRQHGITAPLDVHLMVEPVDDLITQFASSGVQYISFHPEASRHVDRSLQLILDNGIAAGLALNPATPLSVLDYLWDKLDFILLMSVNPGFGGQKFIPKVLDKIKATADLIEQYNPAIKLAVDGGVNIDNIGTIASAGANMFIAGSAVFNSNNYQHTIAKMRAQLPASS